MTKSHIPSIEKCYWEGVRDRVKKINRTLFDIIEQISPSERLFLYKIRYPYGQKITKFGTLMIPDSEQSFIPITSPQAPRGIQSQLTYCPTPLILQLSNKAEVFLDLEERTIPLNVIQPGDLYGLFESIIKMTNCPMRPIWDVSSGMRSTFMLPRVTDKHRHFKLKLAYNAPSRPPHNLTNHWPIFKAIAKQEQSNPWFTEILVFPKLWLKERDDDINWLKFQNYLLSASWRQSQFMRITDELDLLWENFSAAIGQKHLNPNVYIVDTIKHIVQLANGTVPGFKPINNDPHALPAQMIEHAYCEQYGLSEYLPTIIGPYKIDNDPLYYSMSFPTLREGSPSIRRSTNTINEIREVKYLINIFIDTLKQSNMTPDTLTFSRLKKMKFEYFHDCKDQQGDVSSNKKELSHDKNLLATSHKYTCGKAFSMKSPFLRGCIRLSPHTY
ncbi:MAG: hypothetical protein ACE365_03170 [Gammaproteobacteria bacterium]